MANEPPAGAELRSRLERLENVVEGLGSVLLGTFGPEAGAAYNRYIEWAIGGDRGLEGQSKEPQGGRRPSRLEDLERAASRERWLRFEVRDTSRRLDELERSIEEQLSVRDRLEKRLEELGSEIGEAMESAFRAERVGTRATRLASDTRDDLFPYFAAIDADVPFDDVRARRVEPIRIFISDHRPELIERLRTYVVALLEEHDSDLVHELPEELGSWYGRWFSRTRNAMTSDQGRVIAQGVEDALLAPIEKGQAEVAAMHAESAARLLEGLGEVDVAAFQYGSFLLLKYTDDAGKDIVISRSLTPGQRAVIERSQELLASPHELLVLLGAVIDDTPPPDLMPGA
jgi:hypothetical protein